MPLSLRSTLATFSALLLGTFLPATALRADTLSWGSLNPTYAPTPAQATQQTQVGTVNGNNVSVQFDSSTFFSNSTNNSTAPASPAVGTYGTGSNAFYTNGGINGQSALQIISDFQNSVGTVTANSSITVTVFFSRPVSNLMFSFYDVDSGTYNNGKYTDQISNINGVGRGGIIYTPFSLANGTTNAVTAGSNNGFTATGNNAQNAAGGNATVNFGSQTIRQFSFTYTDVDASAAAGSTAANAAHSTLQIIALGDLTFTTVPEPSALALSGLAGGLGFLVLRRARRDR